MRSPLLRPISRIRTPRHVRFEHSSPKPVSPHASFYKTFGRPIAKVLLMATFTYQLAYWAWVKLEKDEIKSQRQSEITALETELRDAVATTKRA